MQTNCPCCGRPTLPDGDYCRFCGSKVLVPVLMTEADEIRRGSARRRTVVAEDDYVSGPQDSALTSILGALLAIAVAVIVYLLYQARGTHFVFTFR